MAMIQTTGFGGRTLYIAKEAIVGMEAYRADPTKTSIFLACGSAEEWIIDEPLDTFKAKYDKTY